MDTQLQQSLRGRHAATLRRWRLFLFIISLVAVFMLELIEHNTVADPHFLFEVTIFGVAIPAVTLFILTVLANQLDGRNAAEAKSDWYRELMRRLDTHQEWAELTRFIVGFPATYLPVDHVSLFIYDHTLAQLGFVTEWNSPGVIESPLGSYRLNTARCRSCCAFRLPALHSLSACGFVTRLQPEANCAEYSQPLFCDGLLVGVQLLRCRPGADLSSAQQEQLLSATAPIALALVLAIARSAQMEQARSRAESDERRRVAAELHDSLGQMVSYLHLNLDRLVNDDRLLSFEDIKKDLARLLQVTDKVYDQIRSDLWTMQPWTAPDMLQAIADYVETITHRSGLDVQLHMEGNPIPLEPRVAYLLFAIVREGLNNIVVHARAQSASVDVLWAADHLQIHLIDDGIGFDLIASSRPGHYGLRMMRERVLELNGTLLIDSSLGRGARLSFIVPIDPSSTLPAVVSEAAEQLQS